ncbi:MAG: transcription termination/antitermination protein NusA [Firmicutes bacterium]|nr:transcription termination/antitermination protein NusA [Bacillota bacterium]
MSDLSDFRAALEQLQKEKGIPKDVIFDALEASLLSACRKNYGTSQNIRVDLNRTTGAVKVWAKKDVVEHPQDDNLEISLEKAQEINPELKVGDVVEIEVTTRNFGRIAAQNAKQVVVQKINEAQRGVIYNEYKGKEREMVSGLIQRKEKRNVYINLGNAEALLSPQEQIPGEVYKQNQVIKVYVLEARDLPKGPHILVSRTHPELVKRLFEQEVPEIHQGIVVIKNIAREAGSRSKLAVMSKDPQIDPLGACVGPNGDRVNAVVNELSGEKIDIVVWNEQPAVYIAAALSPAQVLSVRVDPEMMMASVIVPENQLSLAIGKDGQNARLAARLTGYRIDIKSETLGRVIMDDEEDDYYPPMFEDEDD